MGALPVFHIFGVDIVSALITFGILFSLYLIISLSLNLEAGYTGIPNFGKVLFVAAGGLLGGAIAYRMIAFALQIHAGDLIEEQFRIVAIMNARLATDPLLSMGLVAFTVVVGAGLAAVIGYLASYPAIRLREDYLGMLLLAAGELFNTFVYSFPPIAGGPEALSLPDPLNWADATAGLRNLIFMVILAACALAVFLYVQRIANSPLGRTLRAVRDNEVASEALGKNNVAVRRKTLMIASALAGIAGALWALYLGNISADPTNGTFVRLDYTFFPWVIVILGGAANNYGVAAGTAVLVGLQEAVNEFQTYILGSSIKLPISTELFNVVINQTQYVAIGVLLIVILLWRPGGLIGEKPTHTMSTSKLKAIIDSIEEPKKDG